jgi:hypothetical protein
MTFKLVVNHGYRRYEGNNKHILLLATMLPHYKTFRVGQTALFIDSLERIWARRMN